MPGLAQSRMLGLAEPVWARPSRAMGDGSARALARLRAAESRSRRLRPRLFAINFFNYCTLVKVIQLSKHDHGITPNCHLFWLTATTITGTGT